ncbi:MULTISPECIES: succinylglutamate desuccinylase/aspartoacylase domain-containing protein [Halorussus]|uniref:succinylglutamate desuccinylase/aspartoacylase domain-containing protein n=1 Tax=Halorussus TaxID=1070314 RepID=UPI00209F8CBB|nr:succinylglutamate desuccinylase/aspartoacylase family protein [Halorussus vallis]USZ76840.1 succinylglutamate desuccinylase/aspartoacylase family protein [Halorussus vallis]
MRIEQLGDGTPEVAVVAAIHGDEPCGVRAVERLLSDAPDVERPVKLVVANEEALEKGVRYVEEDLNRAFPGDPNADTHEGRLASALASELRDCTTLSLHSTQSYGEPFALVDTVGAVARSLCPFLPVSVLVQTGEESEGRLISYPHTLEVECGYQGSERAAENAVELVYGFLEATGVLADDEPVVGAARDDVTVFGLGNPVPKPPADEYEVFAENFQQVAAGEAFAAADGDELVAEAAFWPVLMSAYGYQTVFGYRGERIGVLES